jgi:outer membrane lipoprotein-sorting protein
LYCDPATYKPLRTSIVNLDEGTRISEVFEELTLNAEIPDQKFAIPEEK